MNIRIFTSSILYMAVCLFSSCSKTDKIDMKNEKLYPVTFNFTNDFKQVILPMGRATSTRSSKLEIGNKKVALISNGATSSSLSESIVTVEYEIYRSDDLKNFIKRSYQHNTDPLFGNIKEELPAGDYTITMIGASTHDYRVTSWNGYQELLVFPAGADIFSQSLNFTVGSVTEPIILNLDRKVAKLDLNITDSIPNNITTINVAVITNAYIWLNKDVNNIGLGNTQTGINHQITKDEIGMTNMGLSTFITPDSNDQVTTDVNITAYNSTGIIIINKTIKGVKFEKNKKTVLTGTLFTNASNSPLSNFSVKVNGDWDINTNQRSF